jgi:hypothetical protein
MQSVTKPSETLNLRSKELRAESRELIATSKEIIADSLKIRVKILNRAASAKELLTEK